MSLWKTLIAVTQEILEKVLKKHREHIVVKQIAVGREFHGCSFNSKPEVIHFKVNIWFDAWYTWFGENIFLLRPEWKEAYKILHEILLYFFYKYLLWESG